MKTDIQIAQEAKMEPIEKVADDAVGGVRHDSRRFWQCG